MFLVYWFTKEFIYVYIYIYSMSKLELWKGVFSVILLLRKIQRDFLLTIVLSPLLYFQFNVFVLMFCISISKVNLISWVLCFICVSEPEQKQRGKTTQSSYPSSHGCVVACRRFLFSVFPWDSRIRWREFDSRRGSVYRDIFRKVRLNRSLFLIYRHQFCHWVSNTVMMVLVCELRFTRVLITCAHVHRITRSSRSRFHRKDIRSTAEIVFGFLINLEP